MIESERSLWLRAAVLLIPAPMLIALIAYIFAPSIAPEISERSRTEASLAIGFGTAAFFWGVLILGLMSGRWKELDLPERIGLWMHVASRIAIGLGLVSLAMGFSAGGLFALVGSILFFGGFAIGTMALFVRSGRWNRRRTPT